MNQYHPRQQLDLLALAEGRNRTNQINRALSTEVVNLLKLLINECVAHAAIEKGGSNDTKSGLSTCLGLLMCTCDNRHQVNSPTIRKVDAASMASRTVRMRLVGKT